MRYDFEREVWSVTDLVTYVYHSLNSDDILQKLWLEAEISNFSQNNKSKHMYFTLKDQYAKIKTAMFAGNNRRLRFMPRDGDRVLVRGYLSLYDREGQIQFYVQDMRLSGTGDLYATFQRLKEHLAQEGLFNKPKKRMPFIPKKVGVITSANGAALRDILITMRRRLPLIFVQVLPVAVQGDEAAGEIARALDIMNERNEVDVIIIGRGGGSIEEIWAFNEEIVARSIYRSSIPVISAVGHETDTTISDLVADLRAATPTAAAEIVAPDQEDLKSKILHYKDRMLHIQNHQLTWHYDCLYRLIQRPVFQRPEARLTQYAQRVDNLQGSLTRYIKSGLVQSRHRLNEIYLRLQFIQPKRQLELLRERVDRAVCNIRIHMLNLLSQNNHKVNQWIYQLEALSPLMVMKRGYSMVYTSDQKRIIQSYKEVKIGENIMIHLAEGILKCSVQQRGESVDE